MSLRRAIFVAMSILAILALGAAASLVVLTDHLSATAAVLHSHLESVRAAQQVELDLLIHSHARSPLARTMLAGDMWEGLHIVRQYVTSQEEADAVAFAEERLTAYLQAAQQPDPTAADAVLGLDLALGALRSVADLNIEQARAAEAQSARWDRFGDRLGLGIALTICLSVPLTLAWISLFAFRPMLGIVDAMKAFAAGDTSARAPTRGGIEELRTVGEQLNAMTTAIKRQRDNQLAFLAGVSHDLRNPLNALNMSVAVLSKDGPLPSEDQIRRMAEITKHQIHFLSRMVDDLHDAQQIEAGGLTLRLEICDVRAVMREVYELFRQTSADHRPILDVPAEPVMLRCDPVRLRQVLNNLVSNAIKYSPGGGSVRLVLRRAGEQVVVEVSDSGVGIPEEERAYIFEPFRRSRSTKQEIPGTGLGLHVSQRIIQAHGGTIEVESEVGKGSTFRVQLPAGAA